MNIGILETIPVLRHHLVAEQKKNQAHNQLFIEKARIGKNYDLIVSDQSYLPESIPYHTDLIFIPGHARFGSVPENLLLITGGMNQEDTVTFSSIREESAMLCLQKEIFYGKKIILPFESPVLFDRNYGLYHNLATGFLFALADLVFGEEI